MLYDRLRLKFEANESVRLRSIFSSPESAPLRIINLGNDSRNVDDMSSTTEAFSGSILSTFGIMEFSSLSFKVKESLPSWYSGRLEYS